MLRRIFGGIIGAMILGGITATTNQPLQVIAGWTAIGFGGGMFLDIADWV